MESAQEKINRLGGIETAVYTGDKITLLPEYVFSRKSGVVVLNDNSMIDTYRISDHDLGLVGPQAVDLERMSGSRRVLEVIEAMKSNPNCVFLPGTLLRDYGGFCLSVMPIIKNGKLVYEKPVNNGVFYADDFRKLAGRFFGKAYADSISSFSGMSTEEPMKSLLDRLGEEVRARKAEPNYTFDVNGLRVAPVVGNDLRDFALNYNGSPVDVVCHSSSCLLNERSDLKKYYSSLLESLGSRGKLNYPVVLTVAEQRDNDAFAGRFSYNPGRLEQLNLKG